MKAYKKDFAEIAKAIRTSVGQMSLIYAMIKILKESNPKFDADEFQKACLREAD